MTRSRSRPSCAQAGGLDPSRRFEVVSPGRMASAPSVNRGVVLAFGATHHHTSGREHESAGCCATRGRVLRLRSRSDDGAPCGKRRFRPMARRRRTIPCSGGFTGSALVGWQVRGLGPAVVPLSARLHQQGHRPRPAGRTGSTWKDGHAPVWPAPAKTPLEVYRNRPAGRWPRPAVGKQPVSPARERDCANLSSRGARSTSMPA